MTTLIVALAFLALGGLSVAAAIYAYRRGQTAGFARGLTRGMLEVANQLIPVIYSLGGTSADVKRVREEREGMN
jgi:hypothetical protein